MRLARAREKALDARRVDGPGRGRRGGRAGRRARAEEAERDEESVVRQVARLERKSLVQHHRVEHGEPARREERRLESGVCERAPLERRSRALLRLELLARERRWHDPCRLAIAHRQENDGAGGGDEIGMPMVYVRRRGRLDAFDLAVHVRIVDAAKAWLEHARYRQQLLAQHVREAGLGARPGREKCALAVIHTDRAHASGQSAHEAQRRRKALERAAAACRRTALDGRNDDQPSRAALVDKRMATACRIQSVVHSPARLAKKNRE